jgi:Amiloride-sensitive sodium channel
MKRKIVWGKVKHSCYFSVTTSFKFVSAKNKVCVSFCPVFHTAPFSPIQILNAILNYLVCNMMKVFTRPTNASDFLLSCFSVAEIGVVMRENEFIALRRSQLYGTTEFLANCGGLLGLFLGFSIVSILELVYFCTIRLFCNFQMYLQTQEY